MSKFGIANYAALHPHTARLRRRRSRRLAPIRPSRANELWYRAELTRQLLTRLRTAGMEAAAELRYSWPKNADDSGALLALDAGPPNLKALINRLAARFGGVQAQARAMDLAKKATTRNLGTVDQRLRDAMKRSVGINVKPLVTGGGRIADEMDLAVRANVNLITSIPVQYFDRLEDEIIDSFETGLRWESLADAIGNIADVTESRIKLIARDQTSKMNAAFNQVRQTDLGIEQFEWQTAGDERVRDSHAELDGEVFDWDNPPLIDGIPMVPGEDINCRCNAIPIFNIDEVDADAGMGGIEREPDELDFEEAA